ncbi:hypothetical protein Q8A73_008720 [Channa argus]|nr:hypothetical protein Q8A73_008720 [Channa argus]
MERHEAGQEEKLVETFKGVHPPRDGGTVDSRCCYKCLVAVVAGMGLVILTILLLGFISYYFGFFPQCNQDAPSPEGTGKVDITCKLNVETDEKGRYDILTVNKAANYLVYGWVKLTNITDEETARFMCWNSDQDEIRLSACKH